LGVKLVLDLPVAGHGEWRTFVDHRSILDEDNGMTAVVEVAASG
jgi:hypothetical protein